MAFWARSAAAAWGSGAPRLASMAMLVEHQGADALDALGGAIPFDPRGLADALGKQVQQPAGFDAAGNAHQRRLLVAAVFGLHGHQELVGGHGAGRRQ